MKKLNYQIKEQMVKLAGACFWFWASFHSFLSTCGVSRQLIKRYPKETFNKYTVMRNILERLDEAGQIDVIKNIVSGFYRLTSPIDKDNLDVDRAKMLLAEFRELVGNDPIERAVEEQQIRKRQKEARKIVEKTQEQIRKLEGLRGRFLSLFSDRSYTPQQRGFELESLFFELLEIEEFEYTKSFRGPGEQIDGLFSYSKFDYLVEVKWAKDTIKQDDLSIFDGKIRGKAQSTRGLFLAVNSFDGNAVKKFSGDRPSIILMDGVELTSIYEGRRTFFDLLKFKVDALVRYGDIYRTERGS